jgi:hypothetical protein
MIEKTIKCDICGKHIKTGELKKSNFSNDNSMKVIIKDFNDNDVVVRVNLDIIPNNKNDDHLLKDVYNNYALTNYNEPEYDENVFFKYINNSFNASNNKSIVNNEVHICNICYKGIVMLVSKYGKFNKTVKI